MTVSDPFTLFEPAFAQRALLAVLLVALAAGALGGTIVLRDLPFFTHAVGTGAYPLLVLGLILGIGIAPAAIVGTLLFALLIGAISGLGRGTRPADDPGRRDALIGIGVAGALAIGSVLAATAGSSDARFAVSPEALLFGSVLTASNGAVLVTAIVAVTVATAAFLLHDRWLAAGFDPPLARQLRASRTDLVLLACVALAVGAALPVTGSLLAGALLIAPSASARIVVSRANALMPVTLAIAVFCGVFGLYLSLNFDLPAGAAIAAVAGAVFLLTAALATLRQALPRAARPALALLLLTALALSGCGGSKSTDAGDGQLKVVATTPQIADIVRQVGGGAISAEAILPPGADPHEYEPKPSAVAAIAESDVVFRSGGDVDAWLVPAVKASGENVEQVDLSRSAVLLPAVSDGDHHGDAAFNAHWYLAPENVVRAAVRVRDELIKLDPDARETFRANASAYIRRAQLLQRTLERCSSKIPSSDRRLMAGHNDFNYLADAIDYEIAAQLAENGESEPSASDLQQAVDDARAADVRALVTSRGEVTALAEQTASKLDIPLLQLWADSLAETGRSATLLGAISDDAVEIFAATGGSKCPAAN